MFYDLLMSSKLWYRCEVTSTVCTLQRQDEGLFRFRGWWMRALELSRFPSSLVMPSPGIYETTRRGRHRNAKTWFLWCFPFPLPNKGRIQIQALNSCISTTSSSSQTRISAYKHNINWIGSKQNFQRQNDLKRLLQAHPQKRFWIVSLFFLPFTTELKVPEGTTISRRNNTLQTELQTEEFSSLILLFLWLYKSTFFSCFRLLCMLFLPSRLYRSNQNYNSN